MADAVLISSNPNTGWAAGGSYIFPAGNSNMTADLTEANSQRTYRTSGVLSKLYIRVPSNTVLATSTFRTRKDGANGAQSVSITTLATGEFQDNSNTDTVTAGEKWNFQLLVGAGGTSITAPVVSCVFAATTNTVMQWTPAGVVSFSTASNTTFYLLAGSLPGSNATEANCQFEVNSAGTWKNGYIYVSANARSTASTLRSRIDTGSGGANGNIAVSITASTTGIFEDTANSDSVSANNKICLAIITGTGTGSTTIRTASTEYLTTDESFHTLTSQTQATAQGLTRYFALGGINTSSTATETNVSADIDTTVTASNYVVYISTNTLNVTSVFTVRVNQAASALSISITAAATGLFEDTDTVSITSGDEMNYEVVNPAGTGSITFFTQGVKLYIPAAGGAKINLLAIMGVG